MDFKAVKQLADLMDQRGLTHIEVCEGDNKISLSKEQPVAAATAPAVAAAAPGAAAPAAAPAPVVAAAPAGAPAATPRGEQLKSPLVGVVYLAPAPGADPFVRPGSQVKKGQTLCIVEAMKVMNEFTAPRDGEIAVISVDDGQVVEFGQCLFHLA